MSGDGKYKYEFRTDDLERQEVAKFNKDRARVILEQAGITPDNPDYQQYFTLTMRNVHNTGRFGSYNDAVENMFIEMLKNQDMTLEQYKQATEKYYVEVIEKQQLDATGSTFSGKDERYSSLKSNIDETIKSGIEMRQEFGTEFPKEFYDENGKLRSRIVVEIPAEMQENSALGMIGGYAGRHDGVSFDRENNVIIDNGKKVGPEKFFKGKKELLDDRFLTKISGNEALLDMEDSELFDVIRKGDYKQFQELRKQRGMARNKTNEALRNALSDPNVFKDVSDRMAIVEDKSSFLHEIKDLAMDYDARAKLVRKEAEKETLEVIDRIMFSVSPYDVATQSTFRDWKSCMNAVGCNHRFVDDSIGMGSVVAYGYDSKNPQKKVSRLLIHPFINDNGEVAYKVNPRIYGHENMAFRSVVEDVVRDSFNEGKDGTFVFNKGVVKEDKGFLYDDGGSKYFIVAKADDNGIVDLSKYVDSTSEIDMKTISISDAKKVVVSDNIVVKDMMLPNNIQIEVGKNVQFTGLVSGNFSNVDDLKLENYAIFSKNAKYPEKIDCSSVASIEGYLPKGCDFSGSEGVVLKNVSSIEGDINLPKKVEMVGKIPEGINFIGVEELKLVYMDEFPKGLNLPKKVEVKGKIPGVMNFEGVEELKLVDIEELPKGISLPKKVEVNGKIPEGMKFDDIEELKLVNMKKIPKGVNLPKKVEIVGKIPEGISFDGIEELKLVDVEELPEGLNLPKKLELKGKIPEGMNFGDVEELKLDNIRKYPQDISFPKKLEIEGYFPERLSFDGVEHLKLSGDVCLYENINYNKRIDCSDINCVSGYIKENCDFGNKENLALRDYVNIEKDAKLPSRIDCSKVDSMKGCIPEGCDFGNKENLTLRDVEKIGEGVNLPKSVEVTGKLSDNIDLSTAGKVEFSGRVYLGENVKLPNEVGFSNYINMSGYIPENMDLSGCSDFVFDDKVIFGKGVKLPSEYKYGDSVSISGFIPDNMEIKGIGIKLDGDVYLGEDVKLGRVSDVSKAKIKGDVVFQSQLKDADFSEASSLTFSHGENFSKDIKLPKNGSVTFESLVCTGDVESLHKIAEIDNKAMVIMSGELPEGCKIADTMTLLFEEEGKAVVVLPKEGAEEAKKKVLKCMLGGNSELTPEAIVEMEKSGQFKFVTQDEFSQSRKVVFEKKVIADNGVSIEPKEQTKGIKDVEEDVKVRKQKMDDRINARGHHGVVNKEIAERASETAKKRKGFADWAMATANKFNDSVDSRIDRFIDKGTNLLNNSAVGKAYLKAENAVLDTKVVKETKGIWGKVTKAVGESAVGKACQKVATKVGTKVAAKVGGKSAVKCIVKKIPIISAVAGTGFAIERCLKGEWGAAGGEFLSGLAGCFPGVGTAASVAIDVGLAANDISNAIKESDNASVKEDCIAEAKSKGELKVVKEQIAQRGEDLRKEGRLANASQNGEVVKTTLTNEQIAQQKMRA